MFTHVFFYAKGSAKKALRILNLIFLRPFSRKYKEDCIINLVFSKINIDSTYYRKCISRFLKLMFSSFSFCKNCTQKKQFDSLTFFRLFHRQYEQTNIVLSLKIENEIQAFEPHWYKLFSWNSVMASEELQRQQYRIPRIVSN